MADIKCPYCFKVSKPYEVVFRSENPYDDFVVDEKSRDYVKYFLGRQDVDDSMFMNKPVIKLSASNSDGTPIKINPEGQYNRRIPVKVVKDGVATEIRLCPQCHNVLPIGAGVHEMKIIAVVGDSGSGKSVYLGSLIRSISRNSYMGSSITVATAQTKLINQYWGDIENSILPPSTPPNVILPPFVFTYESDVMKNSVIFSFFDVAGEGLRDEKYLKKQVQQIKHADGIFYIIEPTQIEAVNALLKKHAHHRKYNSPSETFNNLHLYLIGNINKRQREVPLAIILSKSDMIENLTINGEKYTSENKYMFSRETVHKECFDTQAFENLQTEVLELIKLENNFFNQIKRNFLKRGFFAVSALGNEPKKDEGSGGLIKIDNVHPCRVEEPFLWIMAKLGLIRAEPRIDEQEWSFTRFFTRLFGI